MDITLVIPAHNEEDYIGSCLEAAIKHSRGAFKEIIVVDNVCTDKTAEIARGYPGVRVVREERKGLTSARQGGFEAATSELVAYTDADTHLPEHWIDLVQQVFKDRPDVVSLSGPARYYDGTFVQNAVMGFFWWVSAPIMYRLVGYMVYGANFVVRKSAIEKIGGFDRTIEFYGEDTDIARRLSKVGRTIFRMDFFIYTSARRLQKEGIVGTNVRYALNFFWPVIFGKPFTMSHKDIRRV